MAVAGMIILARLLFARRSRRRLAESLQAEMRELGKKFDSLFQSRSG